MAFNEDFWIDERNQIIDVWRTHADVVAKKILDIPGTVTMMAAREHGFEPGTLEWDVLIFGCDESAYKIAMTQWNWIRGVASDGNVCMAQVSSMDSRKAKRIALGFENVYGDAVYEAEFLIEVSTELRDIRKGSSTTLSSDFWGLDAGEVPSSRAVWSTWMERAMIKEGF